MGLGPALQYQAEQALEAGIKSSKAQSGVVMVMSTKSGDLLATAGMVRAGRRIIQPGLK